MSAKLALIRIVESSTSRKRKERKKRNIERQADGWERGGRGGKRCHKLKKMQRWYWLWHWQRRRAIQGNRDHWSKMCHFFFFLFALSDILMGKMSGSYRHNNIRLFMLCCQLSFSPTRFSFCKLHLNRYVSAGNVTVASMSFQQIALAALPTIFVWFLSSETWQKKIGYIYRL